MHLPAGGEYYCFSGFDRKTFRTSSLFTITYNFSPRATLSFYGAGCCLSLAQSATVKIKNIVATADMRRHSDTLRAANATTKEEVNGGENRGIHERDPCRLTWAISGEFRLVVLGILLYSCVLRTKTRSKIAPWQVQRSFARRICAKAMKSPQTIRRYWQGL